MEYKIVTLSEMSIAGLSVRTGNYEPDMMQKIGGIWQKLFAGAINEIANRKNDTIYGLYTNYESDVSGKYDMVAGCEVSIVTGISKPFVNITVPAGEYAKFTFHGDAQKDTADFWNAVWNTPLKRKYTCDFEEYPPCQDSANAEINIYIALED